ncbi:phosphotransferase [Mycolicibacterium wolinskyi]|uniref:Aminoglycoside phosphotransferase n=1 Tax=Mycolicibacterium wolinskyi TaxID=59750 RepID=A0A1X2FHZ6_9MYCO|nr:MULTISPECIES: phosphotransferase [Mycolicibacterium]MCV7290162.1 phosphotransferase [Mycolicibacterium wolinskyi]MCV7292874.1 phosphotransferase [Mycolicibacterium goodii]ORX18052.1 aminoglycoside phosphotransferase [Mycolicibacterium wolinskyi]
MLTADQLADRTARAVAAATAAGTELGLDIDEPRVLYDVFSVIVHLAPSPVVARVPTVLPRSLVADPDRQTAQQKSELAVTGWLADRGLPVVPPSPLVPCEPVRRDGFSMTFWQLVEQLPDAEPDWNSRLRQTARLHAALRDYDGPLSFWAPFGTYIPEGLAELQGLPELISGADLERAQREWAVLAPVLTSRAAFESAFPGVDLQPIHGDAPYYNMIATPDGELWSDFELVTIGAVESDLAMIDAEGIASYDAAATELGLRPIDERVLRVTEAAGRLATIAALAMAPELPMLTEHLTPVIDAWRDTPPVTEL